MPEGSPSQERKPNIDEIVEIYGECTAYVSQNDIDTLHRDLSPAEFAEVGVRLGWAEGQSAVGPLETEVRELLRTGDREGAIRLVEDSYKTFAPDPDLDGDEDL
jgi:hypothetical protein